MRQKSKIKNHILLIARIIFGLVFLFSGFVKAVDPLGTAYKISDYLEAFSLTPLDFLAFPSALILIATEFTIGFNILFNVHLKATTLIASIFMLIMTPVTLYLALANPISDCGCFGDAIVMTNWQTFYKNVVLCIILIIIAILKDNTRPWLSNWGAWIVTLLPILISFGISIYCYNLLPILDFRPYKKGNNIIEGMSIPEDAPLDKYETTFFYEKDGVEKAFTLDNYPAEDSTWTFVRQESKLIEQGYVPPIHDFSIVTEDGDITDIILEDAGYTLLIISHKVEKASTRNIKCIKSAIANAKKAGAKVIWLTSSYTDEIDHFRTKYGINDTFGATDDITLKTIVRSNPGLVLIKDANIIEKWHHNSLPTKDELNQLIN
ncbi:MAG: DoxX family protein [Paludibacteraceae bacterium]|nr:DoxX family protein [Paludibacteraceae bacterium]